MAWDSDDTTNGACGNRLSNRLRPWRPQPLIIPDPCEHDDGCSQHAGRKDAGSCRRDELAEVEREIQILRAERAAVQRVLEHTCRGLERMNCEEVQDSAGRMLTMECPLTPIWHRYDTNVGMQLEEDLVVCRESCRTSWASSMPSLQSASPACCWGLNEFDSKSGVLSARPASACLFSMHDRFWDDEDGEKLEEEGPVGQGVSPF